MKTLEAGTRIVFKNILFATDFSSCSNAALPYAIALTRRFGAKLYGAHVLATGQYLFLEPGSWAGFVEEVNRLKQTAVEKMDEQLRAIPHQALSRVGNVCNVLEQLIDDHDVDLVVVGTHGRTGARKVVMGSTAEKIYRSANCPVLSIGPIVPRDLKSKIQFRRILFATDFAPECSTALPYAVSLAEEDQAELVLLHVIKPPAAGIVNEEEVKASLMRTLQNLVPQEAAPWCRVTCMVEVGQPFAPPAERILDVAKDLEPDLIVLGVRPLHGAFARVTHLAQSTAQQIVANATCPVLTIRG